MYNSSENGATRSNALYKAGVFVTNMAISMRATLTHTIDDHVVDELKEKPIIVLPTHQRMIDIPLEGIFLYKQFRRPAYFIMKSSLPAKWFLKKLGGIPLVRGDELKRKARTQRDKQMNKSAFEAARKLEQEVYERTIPYLLERREIIVTHPEGTRNKNDTVNPRLQNFGNVLNSQRLFGQQI